MPKFSYVAMDSRGKETKGTLEVGTQNEAIGRLKEMGFFPTKVVEEKGGEPEVVLARLSEFMEKAQKIKGKVVAAMFYPAAVITVAVVILAVLMVWVVPKFKDIFKDMLPGKPLPGFTRFVLGISDAIAS